MGANLGIGFRRGNQSLCQRMIRSENRFPPFWIMRKTKTPAVGRGRFFRQ
jgi:hypothetical protein